MTGSLVHVAVVVLVVLLVLVGVTFLVTVLLRLGLGWRERRTEAGHGLARNEILVAVLGDPEESPAACRALASHVRRQEGRIEDQAFRMLRVTKGEARAVLVDILLAGGASHRACRLVRSHSSVRRSRGAYRLGSLGQPKALQYLVPLLKDRTFMVRRMAVRALGNIGDPRAVGPLLRAGANEPRLTHDLGYAFLRVGVAAAPQLRRTIEVKVAGTTTRADRGEVAAAMALGAMGDAGAVPVLVQAVLRGGPGLQLAATTALGEIGSPEAIDALVHAVGTTNVDLRIGAAAALGRIGAVEAVDGLTLGLESSSREVARVAARALLSLHDAGRQALLDSPSPYAAEALAVDLIRKQR